MADGGRALQWPRLASAGYLFRKRVNIEKGERTPHGVSLVRGVIVALESDALHCPSRLGRFEVLQGLKPLVPIIG